MHFFSILDPLNPRSDWHLICPKSNTTQSLIKIMRIREIILNYGTLIVNLILLVSTEGKV